MKFMRASLCFFCALWPLTASAAVPAIPFTVTMSEAVNVTGSPRIILDVDGNTRYAVYSAGTGTASLTFTYTATAGDVDLNGIGISSTSVDLNGGTITDLNGNPETNLTFTAPANMGSVNVNYPSLAMDFINDADGRYSVSGTIYNDLTSFLTATGGSFTRASTATYFDSTGTLQTAASGAPRFEYDPVTHAAKGILIEESRTNYITNSTLAGAIAGTPGTLPTGWSAGGSTGLSSSVIATGTMNGMLYIDIRVYGTVTSTGNFDLTFLPATSAAAASGQIWSTSAYIAVIAGALPAVTYLQIWEVNSAGVWQAGSNFSLASATSTLTRYSGTRTLSNASTAYVRTLIELLNVTSGTVVDFTIRIAAPQLERGSFITSYIPTTSAAVTRAADVLSVPTTGGWFNASATSVYASFNSNPINGYGVYRRVIGTSGAGNADYGELSNADVFIRLWDNSSALDQSSSAILTGETYATSSSASGRSLSVHGAGAVSDAAVMPAFTAFSLGSQNGSTNFLNGHLAKFKYYPLRVSDTQLQLLSQ